MPEVTKSTATVAKELGGKFGTPSLIYRGFVLDVDEVEGGLVAVKFLGYGGTTSTFLLTQSGGNLEVCSIEVIEKPRVMRNRVTVKGFFRVVTCVECP